MSKFSIIITTKNRLEHLIFTLGKINMLLQRDDVECLIFDDGSTDDTSDYIKAHHQSIRLFRNEQSKGLIYCRNMLLQKAVGKYAVSIDDDLHFITANPLGKIEQHFLQYPNCAVVSFRLFWSTSEPESTSTQDKSCRIQSFAGGAHALRLDLWKKIPPYPEWFIFYGEENFASFHLFKNNLEVYYLPEVLVHHRVNLTARKIDADYVLRMRRAMRAGWYLFFLFYPLKVIPRKMASSVWSKFRYQIFKGNLHVLKALLLATGDLIISAPRVSANRNALSMVEYKQYRELASTPLYWKPNGNK